MLPASPHRSSSQPLRIGIPWRTSEEQRQGERKKLDYYFASVRQAGAEPVDVALDQSPAAPPTSILRASRPPHTPKPLHSTPTASKRTIEFSTTVSKRESPS